MEKGVLLVCLIELIVLLIPVAALFIKFGQWKSGIEKDIEYLKVTDVQHTSRYESIMGAVNTIEQVIVRLEVKLDERTSSRQGKKWENQSKN